VVKSILFSAKENGCGNLKSVTTNFIMMFAKTGYSASWSKVCSTVRIYFSLILSVFSS
jgi:hypothetical protein